MKPTRFTLLPSIFISTSLHVSGNYVHIIRRTYCIYATLVFFTLYGWLSDLHVSGNYVCIIRRTCCIYATLIFFQSVWVAVWSTCFGQLCVHHQENLLYLCDTGIFTLYVGQYGLLQIRQPHIQCAKYLCRTDTVSSPDDGHTVARNMYSSWNTCTKK